MVWRFDWDSFSSCSRYSSGTHCGRERSPPVSTRAMSVAMTARPHPATPRRGRRWHTARRSRRPSCRRPERQPCEQVVSHGHLHFLKQEIPDYRGELGRRGQQAEVAVVEEVQPGIRDELRHDAAVDPGHDRIVTTGQDQGRLAQRMQPPDARPTDAGKELRVVAPRSAGSKLSPNAPIFSIRCMTGSQRCFWSSDPHR